MSDAPSPAAPAARELLLVALDFSPESDRAFALALRFAVALDADLLALHVVHGPAADPGFYTRDAEGRRDRRGGRTLVMTGGDLLDQCIARARDAHPTPEVFARVATRLVAGTPGPRIVEVALEAGASHIFMGSRGRAGWKGILLGSTAQRVIQLSPLPITLVKLGADAPAPAPEADAP